MPDINYLSISIQTGLVGMTTFLLAKWILRERPKKRLPPGPKQYPIFGNGLSLWKNEEVHKKLDEWMEKYGDIYSLRLGRFDLVVLSSKDSIHDLLVTNGDITSHRPITLSLKLLDVVDKGIVNNMGESWKRQKRTALSSLRDFGIGKASLEGRILEEADFVCNVLTENEGVPKALDELFISYSMNIIYTIIFGNRVDYEEPEFVYLKKEMRFLFSQGGLKNIAQYYPEIIILFPFLLPSMLPVVRRLMKLQNFIMGKITEHKESYDPDNIRDFVDVYLKAKADGDTEDPMFLTILDLFTTGTETTSTALNWCILFLIHNPKVQEKCRAEVLRVLDSSQRPRYQDRGDLPYVEATIHETLRRANIAPVSLVHATTAQMKYREYVLPKNTLIVANMYSVHLDPNNFEDPLEFRPERWLDDSGKCRTNSAYLPFGIGPRECLGRSLAYQEFFLLLVTLLQRFRFNAEDLDNLPQLSGKLGITHQADPFRVIVERI